MMRLIYIFLVFFSAIAVNGLHAQCNASNASQFLNCLTVNADNITISGSSFTIGGDINLSGDIIDLGSGNREVVFSGTVTISSTTQFLGSGSVKITNGPSASPAGGQGVITFAALNAALATGSYTSLQAAMLGILPVELTGFRVAVRNSGLELQWSTASELNNARFLIERSGADGSFSSIGEVKGAGTTSTPQDYKFTDRNPMSGTNYYRLRQEDFDGKFEYSPVIAAQGPASVTETMKITPNPVYGRQIRLEMPAGEMPLRIELRDVNGKYIQIAFKAMENNSELALPQHLPAGMYYLTAVFADKALVSPVVVK